MSFYIYIIKKRLSVITSKLNLLFSILFGLAFSLLFIFACSGAIYSVFGHPLISLFIGIAIIAILWIELLL